jgi:FkbM family methyltransferase
MKLPVCEARRAASGDGRRFFCAHPAVHAPRQLISAEVCQGCTAWHGPRPEQFRPVPSWTVHADRINPRPAAAHGSRVLICTRHGLGDAVQLSVVLQHLARYHPDWTIDLAVTAGKETAYHGQARQVFCDWSVDDRDRLLGERLKAYDQVYDLAWHEPRESYADSPSTKAERCLREVFGLQPVIDLCRRYVLNVRDAARKAALAYLQEVAGDRPLRADGRFPVCVIHYQGDSSTDLKDLEHADVHWICQNLITDFQLVPVILDWDSPPRSPLIDQRQVFNPGREHPLWKGLGIGDAETIAALIEQSALMIGIDSGPLHVAAATTTPTVAVWKGYHPVHYLCPADNVVNLVPEDHARLIRGDREKGLSFFARHYQYRVQRSLLVDTYDLIADLTRAPGLRYVRGHWIRNDNVDQDLTIVGDVYEDDCYQVRTLPPAREVVVDVGACLGSFAKLVHERNPTALVIACECCPENVPLLRRNVGGFAQVVEAAVTYERDVALLNAVYPHCASTGGSTVVSREAVEQYASGPQQQPGLLLDGAKREYWADLRPLATVTLEGLCRRFGVDHIDLLKLDCEGSEFSILEHCDRSRIHRVVGEYHGWERFQALIAAQYSNWQLEILRPGDLGLFRLTNPHFGCGPLPGTVADAIGAASAVEGAASSESGAIERAAIRAIVPVPRIVVDVGAAHGDFAAEFARQAERVYLFEPNPYYWPAMPDHMQQRFPSARVLPFGISDRTRLAELLTDCPEQLATVEPWWKGQWPAGTFRTEATTPVQLIGWDDFLRWFDVSRIDLLKIDTEGHDPVILQAVLAGPVLPRVIQWEENTPDQRVSQAVAAAEARGYRTVARVCICPHRGFFNRVLARD